MNVVIFFMMRTVHLLIVLFAIGPETTALLLLANLGPPVRPTTVSAPMPPPPSTEHDDASFEAWIEVEFSSAQGLYPEVFADAKLAVVNWRKRYREQSPRLWKSLMRADKIVKELSEAAPVIDAVRSVVAETPLPEGQKFTIIDLCSGKGFLSMFLSEMLDPSRVERCFLVDKSWPPHNMDGPIGRHHISDEHIYGERASAPEEGADFGGAIGGERAGQTLPSYFERWPVPLHTSKQNLKNKATVRSLSKHLFGRCSGPVLILAVHLCGTLSLRAVDLFNNHPEAKLLVLKPCCLPGMVHAKRNETFEIGAHAFDAKDVCASGRFTAKGEWRGPPRHHLRARFNKWTEHLCKGIDLGATAGQEPRTRGSAGAKAVHRVEVQTKGGYQNLFCIAERHSPTVANGLAGDEEQEAKTDGLSASLWKRISEAEMRPQGVAEI